MDLKSPATLGLAWILAPLLITLAAAGLGAGLARLAGLRLGALTVPAGFLAGVVLMTFLAELGVPGLPVVALCALAALAGGVLWSRQRDGRPAIEPAPAVAALGAYAIGMAPLVGSGRSGIVGYILNNDPSVHISVVELLRENGARAVDHNASSYDFVSNVFTSGYPVGSHVWPMFGSTLTGADPFHTWTPLIALMLGLLALVTYELVRGLGAGRVFAAVAGTVVACGYLPFSYLAQGGAKEVAVTLAVYATLALLLRGLREGPVVGSRDRAGWRSLLPAALAAAAGIGIFGLGALAWLGPLVVGALLIAGRTRVMAVAGAAGIAVLAALPALISSVSFVEGSDDDLVNPAQVGNLLGPVPWLEAFNVWLGYDYRYPEADYRLATRVAIVLAIAFAIVGLLDALRRRRFAVPLALFAGGVGAIVISVRYAIYLDAKSYVVLAPALGLATAAGVLAASRRPARIGIAATAVGGLLALGVLASDALVYAGSWMTPKERFQELIDLSERYEGQGPVLIHDREDYGKYFFRESQPWESWGAWQPDRGFRFGRIPPPPPRTPDFDDYTLDFVGRFRLLVERKSPTGSLPPSNFELVDETDHYRVWRRTGDMPQAHVALGGEELDGAGQVDCANPEVSDLVERAERREGVLVAEPARPEPITAPADTWQQFGGTFGPGPAEGFASRRGGVALPFADLEPGSYDTWIQGGFGPGVRLMIGAQPVGDAFGDLGLHSQWTHLGTLEVEEPDPALAVVGLSKPWWQAGSRRADTTGPLLFAPAGAETTAERIAPGRERSVCGRDLDWLELVQG